MSSILIAVTGVIYLYVGVEQWVKFQNAPMLLTYLGYSFANIGLYLLASK